MYCRGHATRIKIIETYKLVPLGRFKLLNGQSVISDAGNRDIIDEYTVFECIEIIVSSMVRMVIIRHIKIHGIKPVNSFITVHYSLLCILEIHQLTKHYFQLNES